MSVTELKELIIKDKNEISKSGFTPLIRLPYTLSLEEKINIEILISLLPNYFEEFEKEDIINLIYKIRGTYRVVKSK